MPSSIRLRTTHQCCCEADDQWAAVRGRAGPRPPQPQHLTERFTPRAPEEAGRFAQAADNSLHESVPRLRQFAFRADYNKQAIVACLWRQRKQDDATLQDQQS